MNFKNVFDGPHDIYVRFSQAALSHGRIFVIGDLETAMNEGESGDWLTLGAEVDGETLVCHGDDLPDEFVSWLDTLAHQFLYLQEKAEELGVDLVAAKSKSTLFDIVDFCEEIGIDIGSRFC